MKAKKILVIDDEKNMLKMFVAILEGHQVATAENEAEAKGLVLNQDFDLVFLDVVMPGVDCINLLKFIRKTRPEIKIIMMTGFAKEKELQQAFKLGASAVMRKPFEHINKIKEAVSKLAA